MIDFTYRHQDKVPVHIIPPHYVEGQPVIVIEVSEQQFDHMLGAVPPLYMGDKQNYVVGEKSTSKSYRHYMRISCGVDDIRYFAFDYPCSSKHQMFETFGNFEAYMKHHHPLVGTECVFCGCKIDLRLVKHEPRHIQTHGGDKVFRHWTIELNGITMVNCLEHSGNYSNYAYGKAFEEAVKNDVDRFKDALSTQYIELTMLGGL